MQEGLSTSKDVDDRREKPPIGIYDIFTLRMLVFITIQLTLAVSLYIFFPDPQNFIIFSFLSFIVSVTFPWAGKLAPRLFGCLSRDPVDVVYYSLGIIGVSLFFLAERMDERAEGISQSISSIEKRIDFLSVTLSLSGDIRRHIENVQEIESLMSGYLQDLIENYKGKLDFPGGCETPENRMEEYCEAEQFWSDAGIAINVGLSQHFTSSELYDDDYRAVLGWTSFPVKVNHRMYGEQIIEINGGIVFDILYRHKLALGRDLKVYPAVHARVQQLIEQEKRRLIRAKRALRQAQDNQKFRINPVWVANFWPFALIIALASKIARIRIKVRGGRDNLDPSA